MHCGPSMRQFRAGTRWLAKEAADLFLSKGGCAGQAMDAQMRAGMSMARTHGAKADDHVANLKSMEHQSQDQTDGFSRHGCAPAVLYGPLSLDSDRLYSGYLTLPYCYSYWQKKLQNEARPWHLCGIMVVA